MFGCRKICGKTQRKENRRNEKGKIKNRFKVK